MKIQIDERLQQSHPQFPLQTMRAVAADQTNKTKGNQMKLNMVLPLLALGMSAFILNAQDPGGPPPDGGPGGPGGPNGPGGPGRHRPPPDLIIQALDVNHDGVIDAD